MRILQITSDYLPRPLWGMGWHVNQIINGLSDASDYEVYVATAYKSNNVHPNIISTESVKDALLLSDNDYEIFNDFDKFNKWQIVLAEKVLSSNIEFDIVHAHNWMSWLTAKEIKKQKPSVKLYITFHLLQKQYELMKDNPIPSHHNEIIDIENDAIESMDGIIALSDSTIKLLESHYNVSKKKVHHIPHSINFVLREFSELERIKEESKDTKLVFLGRIEEDKGIREVIEVFNMLRNKYEITLDVIGDGPILEELKIDQQNSNVKFHGYLERQAISRILEESHIFCMPSTSENLPLTVLEAMGFGLVPVFTRGQSVPTIYKHNNQGKLIDLVNSKGKLVPNRKQLQLEIEDLLQNPEKRSLMSERSYKLISKKYSIEKMTKSLIELYESL